MIWYGVRLVGSVCLCVAWCCPVLFGAVAPDQQVEADWVDDRWNGMESGRFQASVVPLPSGSVLKGLSILVGEKGEGAVCYDTGSVRCRAIWEGGLLRFNSRRFGVVNGPVPAGEPTEFLPQSGTEMEGALEWEGLRVHGDRVILHYRGSGRLVYESPWWHSLGDHGVLVRYFQVEPGEVAVKIPVLGGETFSNFETSLSGSRITTGSTNSRGLMAGFVADAGSGFGLSVDRDLGELIAMVPASDSRVSFSVWMATPGESTLVEMVRAVEKVGPFDFDAMRAPGRKAWPAIATKGQVSRGRDAYVIDTLTVPYQNPWNALMFLSGVDFFSTGDAAVCTLHGDVWLVNGIDDSLEQLEWHRFATGLFQPLGLQIMDEVVYVLGRDQVTALEDSDGDGYADFYRNHSNLIDTRPGHRFVTSLQSDRLGQLYYVDPEGLHRIAADGQSLETIATGWRNPNGMGRSPDGVLTVAPQQGGWTPSSQISEVRAGGFYGARGPQKTANRPLGYDPPLCWIPHAIDNSGGSQVWGAASGWGPLSGQMIHLSYGRCSMMLGLREEVDGVMQGGVVPLKGRFLSGAMRGAVNPVDGQLYVVGSNGWQTSALRDGSLQRVRYTGNALNAPIGLNVHQDGLRLTFAEPLDPEWANDVESFGIEQWNYRYSKEYGSKDYSIRNPNDVGRDTVGISKAQLGAGGRTVFLSIPELQPVMQMEIRYNLRSLDGGRVRGAVYNTINALGSGSH